jgi:hypothetical protein
MDMVLPKHVRIMWPDGGIATHFLHELRSEGLISDRPMVLVEKEPLHYRARRLFFFRSSREWNVGPWITWLTQRLVQQRIRRFLRVVRAITHLRRHDITLSFLNDRRRAALADWKITRS